MKRTHAERLARALAELDKPCSDEPHWPDVMAFETCRRVLRRVCDQWGRVVP